MLQMCELNVMTATFGSSLTTNIILEYNTVAAAVG